MDPLNIIFVTAIVGLISKIVFDWLKGRKSNNNGNERRQSMTKLTEIAQHTNSLAASNNELLKKMSDCLIRSAVVNENILIEMRRHTDILYSIKKNGNGKS